jgi:hypothetical protein
VPETGVGGGGPLYRRAVAYDVVAESLRLLAHGAPDGPGTLSRRRRFAPLAVDVTGSTDGAVAETLFVRRGVSGRPYVESWTFERRAGEWACLGGAGGPCERRAFGDRPPAARMGGFAVVLGGSGTSRPGRWPLGRRGRWVSGAHVRVAAEVGAVEVGRRRLPVARHGHVCVVWTGPPPPVVLLDRSGRRCGTVTLPGRPGPPS